MHLVIEKATQYQNTVSKYEAEIYIKGRTEILKQNMLIRLAHHIFPIDRKNKDMLFEKGNDTARFLDVCMYGVFSERPRAYIP